MCMVYGNHCKMECDKELLKHIEAALELENKAIDKFVEFSETSKSHYARLLFKRLVEEEQEHLFYLNELKKEVEAATPVNMLKMCTDVKAIDAKEILKPETRDEKEVTDSYISALTYAKEIEDKIYTFFKELAMTVDEKELKDIFVYKGVSFWDIVSGKLSIFFEEIIPRIISNIRMLELLADTHKIKAVILRNDVKEAERSIILSLRRKEVPSLVLQHGILAEVNGHSELIADKFVAWGNASVNWYKNVGNSSREFVVSGNPRFDELVKLKPKIVELRQKGLSYPNIAKELGISTSTAWNHSKDIKEVAEL